MALLRITRDRALEKGCVTFLAPLVAALLGMVVFASAASEAPKSGMAVPEYDSAGALLRPRAFYTWVFVGTSIGLNYSENGRPQAGPGTFHNIYTQPEAYHEYLRTGKFPEKTMFVMPLYKPAQKVSINKQGYFEGDLTDLDASVKDHEHFPEGWAYFNFSSGEGKLVDKAKAFPKAMCYSCHSEHAAHDNVFTQFYPVLRDREKAK